MVIADWNIGWNAGNSLRISINWGMYDNIVASPIVWLKILNIPMLSAMVVFIYQVITLKYKAQIPMISP